AAPAEMRAPGSRSSAGGVGPREVALASALFTVACHGVQSVLDAAGPQAARIGRLWWVFLAVCVIVYALVVAFLLAALARGRRSAGPATSEASLTRAVAI